MTRHALAAARWGLAAGAIALAACQPVDDDVGLESSSPTPGDADVAITDLDGLLEATEASAGEWDADARLVELSVGMDDGSLTEGRATYVGPDADRLLVVEVTGSGIDEQQPTAETLGFEPVPRDALDEVPEPPGDLVEPGELPEEAADALDHCGVDDPHEVLYATGAPAAWDGTAWADAPSWRVTVLDEEGEGVVLGHDGTPRPEPCIEVG